MVFLITFHNCPFVCVFSCTMHIWIARHSFSLRSRRPEGCTKWLMKLSKKLNRKLLFSSIKRRNMRACRSLCPHYGTSWNKLGWSAISFWNRYPHFIHRFKIKKENYLSLGDLQFAEGETRGHAALWKDRKWQSKDRETTKGDIGTGLHSHKNY